MLQFKFEMVLKSCEMIVLSFVSRNHPHDHDILSLLFVF